MKNWSPQEWTVFFGAIATLIAAIAAAAVSVISAVKGQARQTRARVDEHEEASQERGRELVKRIDEGEKRK